MDQATGQHTPIASVTGTQPFTEMRKAVRRRNDRIKAARGIVIGFVIGAGMWTAVWFAAHAAVSRLG